MTYEEMVSGLVTQYNIPRDRAESIARKQLGDKAPPPPDEARRADVLEKAEQAEVVKFFRARGFHVYNLSQSRPTKQEPGLPDLWVAHAGRGVAFWFEVKRHVGGRYTEAQEAFGRECKLAGIPYATGDRFAAAAIVDRLERGATVIA